MLVAILIVAAALAGAAPEPARAASVRKVCRDVCGSVVAECVEQTGKRAKCRRRVLKRCRRQGPWLTCSHPSTTTSTSTSSTTQPSFASTTSTTEPLSFPTTTTTTTSTTTTTQWMWPWIETGPVQWTVPPPTALPVGGSAPVTLAVDVPGVLVEGRVVICPEQWAPDACLASRPASALRLTEPTFSGTPGPFPFTLEAAVDPKSCLRAERSYLVATWEVVDAGGTRTGPYTSPLAYAALDADPAPRISAPEEVPFVRLPADAPLKPRRVSIRNPCQGAPDLTPTASADVPWITLGSIENGELEVGIDTALLPAGVGTFEGTVTVTDPAATNGPFAMRVAVHALDIDAQVLAPLPSQVAAHETVSSTVQLTGNYANASAQIIACDERGRCSNVSFSPLFDIDDDALGGPPRTGTYELRHHLCDGGDVTVRLSLWVNLANGFAFGAEGTIDAFTALPSAQDDLLVSGGPLAFDTIPGVAPPVRYLSPGLSCRGTGLGRSVDWTASADVPWLVVPASGSTSIGGGLSWPMLPVQVDPTGLDPAAGPYAGNVTVVAAGTANGSVSIPVQLSFLPNVAVAWSTPPPAVVDEPTPFPIALSVTGDVERVDGNIQTCRDDDDPLFCFSLLPISISSGGAFDGPPGTFDFTATLFPSCRKGGDGFFGGRFYVIDDQHVRHGPYLVPWTPFLSVALAPPLLVSPASIVVKAIAGQGPFRREVTIDSCVDPAGQQFTVESSAAWLHVDPESGALPLNGERLRLSIDAAALDAAQSPHEATLTITVPGLGDSPRVVPVRVEVLGD